MTALAFANGALVAAPGAAAGSASGARGEEEAPAVVRVAECSRGALPTDRSAEYRGAMRSLPGTDRMAIRFTLEERTGVRRYTALRAPGLDLWRTSRPGVARFVHRQRVLELASATSYRVRVSFRWYDAEGEVLRRATRLSGACRQRGQLPDLRVADIAAERLDGVPGATRYVLQVVNDGRGRSERSEVRFAVDGTTVDTVEVDELAAGERRRVFVTGPACAVAVRAEVDPDDAVRESSERNNVRIGGCPAAR